MTMTHSDEVANGSQKPGPADVSAGVMTPHKKNLLSLYTLLSKPRRLLVHCVKQCTGGGGAQRPRTDDDHWHAVYFTCPRGYSSTMTATVLGLGLPLFQKFQVANLRVTYADQATCLLDQDSVDKAR